MEPNSMDTQNTSNGAQFGAAEGAGLAAQTGPAASTATPMAQTETTVPQMEPGGRVEPGIQMESREQAEPKADGEKKKSHTMLLVVILCLVLAAGGVGFGIWAMVDSDKKDGEIASLREQNEELSEIVEVFSSGAEVPTEDDKPAEPKKWASTEIVDGVFHVLDSAGQVLAQSDSSWPSFIEVLSCESSSGDTLLSCKVNTAEGEGQVLYDANGGSIGFMLEPQQ